MQKKPTCLVFQLLINKNHKIIQEQNLKRYSDRLIKQANRLCLNTSFLRHSSILFQKENMELSNVSNIINI